MGYITAKASLRDFQTTLKILKISIFITEISFLASSTAKEKSTGSPGFTVIKTQKSLNSSLIKLRTQTSITLSPPRNSSFITQEIGQTVKCKELAVSTSDKPYKERMP